MNAPPEDAGDAWVRPDFEADCVVAEYPPFQRRGGRVDYYGGAVDATIEYHEEFGPGQARITIRSDGRYLGEFDTGSGEFDHFLRQLPYSDVIDRWELPGLVGWLCRDPHLIFDHMDVRWGEGAGLLGGSCTAADVLRAVEEMSNEKRCALWDLAVEYSETALAQRLRSWGDRGFGAWLLQQVVRNDPVGDVAQEGIYGFGEGALQGLSGRDLLLDAVNGNCSNSYRDALVRAVREFSSAGGGGGGGDFVLYRHFAADGSLLYVGKSARPRAQRQHEHMKSSHWSRWIAKIEMERFPDAQTLADAEVAAIRAEMPRFNKHHNKGATQ